MEKGTTLFTNVQILQEKVQIFQRKVQISCAEKTQIYMIKYEELRMRNDDNLESNLQLLVY